MTGLAAALAAVGGLLSVVMGVSFYGTNRRSLTCLGLGPAGLLLLAGVMVATGVAGLAVAGYLTALATGTAQSVRRRLSQANPKGSPPRRPRKQEQR